MDWRTFKFCVFIWMLCVSKSKSQSQLHNSTSIQLRSACDDGHPIVPPDECNSCICFAGQIYCTSTPCPEQGCVNGVDVPDPDACNKCVCRRGKVTCSNMICIPAPHCAEKQLYPAQNKCNACMCLNGFITCTSNSCEEEPTTTTEKPKKKKCIEGESLPGPGPECIECFCLNGRKRCKNVCTPTMESRFSEVTSEKPKKKKCIEGESLPEPGLECMECFCQNGKKRCKSVCGVTVESRFSEGPECFPGQHIPRPDHCNNCICFEGQIHCTHLPCRVLNTRIGLECTDNQPVFRPDECNECYCFEGRLECSDLICIRGSKCVEDQVIPKPDSCNACKCVEGHILCTDYQCPIIISRNALRPGRSSTEVRTLDDCHEGDIISPPPPPNDCNTCYCLDNRILCTMNSCEGPDPEIKGRLGEPNVLTDLKIFDKQISVEPFINMLSKNNEKSPTKLIHTHAYNGFHQEIKVHAGHLPKDATKLLKVLATSLDNSALASISQRLLTSSNSLPNNLDSKIPLDNQVVPAKLLGDGNVLTTQSSKLITSGSQSNETILVIPNTEPFDDQNSQSVLPLTTKYETIWKSVSSPASLVSNNQQINPHISQEEKLNVYYNDNPPSTFVTPTNQNNMIRNPSKFSRPGLPHMPSKPMRNTVEIPNTNPQSIYPVSNPKSININDGKISYVPFSQENKQLKPKPSGFVPKRDQLPQLRPYQVTKPGLIQVYNITSSTPIFRPGKSIVTPNNNGGQQKPSQPQFIPNLTKYYPNHVKPQQILFKPNQNHLPTLSEKGIQYPLLFPKNPNPPIVAASQYTQPQFGLKPGKGSISPLNNKDNQTDQQFKVFSPNFQINPPLTNLPNQKKRISNIGNEASKEIPPHFMVPNSTAHHTNILNPPQIGVDSEDTEHKSSHSQFVPNPSIYYRNEYEAPKIIDVNPDQEQLIPHSKISYTHTEHFNPPYTSSEPVHVTLIPKVRNKKRKYNSTHSLYEKHTTITYVSEYDPTLPDNPFQIVHDPNQYQNAPQTNVYEHYLPDQESQELDLTMSKVNYYLNLPNLQLDQNEPHPNLTHYYSSQTSFFPGLQQNYTQNVHPTVTETNKYNQHDFLNIKYPNSPRDSKNTDPHSSSQSQFILSQDNSQKGGLNDPKSEDPQSLSNSAEDPSHPKSNEHLPPASQTGPTQKQQSPGVLDDRGSNNEFQYAHNAYEDPRQLHKLLPSKLDTPQNHQLPGFFDERGSADGFQYPSNSAEDINHQKVKLNKSPHFDPYILIVNPEQPNDNLHISPYSQFGSAQKQHKPGVFDNREDFKYVHNADKNPTHLKPLHKLLPFPHSHSFDPTLIQHSPGMFDERASADGFQYPSDSAENPIHSRVNLHNPKRIQFGPTQTQHLPGMFDEHGSADGLQYLSYSAVSPLHPKENFHKLPNSSFGPTTYKHLPGMYLSNFAGYPTHLKNLTHPEQSKQNRPYSQNGPNHNKPTPGMFAGRGSPDDFQYLSNSVKNHLHPKESLYFAPQNQHLSGVFVNRPPGGFQYSSNSVGNLTHLKDNRHNLPHPQFLPNQNQNKKTIHKHPNVPIGPTQNQHIPGKFDERGSADGFQYPSNSAENPTHPNQNKQIQPNSPFGPAQNQHLPGMFDERGSADGFQYPFNSVENPTRPKDNLHKHPQSQLLPSPNQNTPGVFDDRGSADGFQYPSNSAENPTHPKQNKQIQPISQFGLTQNQHISGEFDERGFADGFQYPSNSAENPTHPKQNKQIQPNSPFGPTQNQHLPGMFDDRGSADGFQYPSNSFENPTRPKDNLHKHPQSQFLSSPNQHTAGVLDDPGSADGFQYPSNSAENPTHPKQNKQIQPNSPFGPAQKQHLPGMFDERSSADGFQYLSNSVENSTRPIDNLHKHPQFQFLLSPNQHIPGVFDDRGSTDSFQHPSNPAGNSIHPKQNKRIQPNSQFGPTQNQHVPGKFEERDSANGFQYPSNSVANPTRPKDNLHQLPQSHFLPSPNQNNQGVFDDRGSADSFQYPSNSGENPTTHPKPNKQIQPNSPFGPAQNPHLLGMFHERGSADGYQYPSNSLKIPTHPKDTLHKLPQSQFLPSPNQHTPGVFDDRGSADGFQYPSNSIENSTSPKDNLHKIPQSQFLPSPNQHIPGVFDDRGSTDGFQYPSNSAENSTHPKQNKLMQPNSQFGPTQDQHVPGKFDERGSADGFQYPSNSVENLTHLKQNKQQPNFPFSPAQNQHLPGMFGEHGSADGFQYPSNSIENPTHPKDNLHKLPQSQFLPFPHQHTPEVFDERGSADGFQYPSNSAENPTHPKNNPNASPDSKFQPQNQPKPLSSNYGYNTNNPLRPWVHLDHDQYKPSSFDNLLNGLHNIPWSFSANHNKDSDTVTSTPEPRSIPDYDQYKSSSFDNLFNEIHQIPWSVPNQDSNALGSDAEITTPPSRFKPKPDQYGPSMVNDPSMSNQNKNTDFTDDVDDNQLQMEQDVSTPSTELTDSDSTQYNLHPKSKPDSDLNGLLPTDYGKIPDFYEQLYPLFKAVKKLSDPPIDDSVLSMGNIDQLELLPILFPGIAKILNYEPPQEHEDVSPDKNYEVQRINPLSKLKSKLKQLPENHNGILNWLKSKLHKLVPIKDNATVTKNDIDMPKIFKLLSKLTAPKLKHTTALQNIPFSGFDSEIIENIMNDFKEDTLTTTSTPRTDYTDKTENQFKSIPTISDESRPQAPQLKYPDVHIILHQPDDEDDVDLPPYIETDGELNLGTDIDSKELSASMFPKILNPRFRHRPKEQKEECGDGTQWISNCHGCSCYFGQAMCFRLPDCELRPLGEPMTCKPYSHFKMGCYTCECNGDGVAECDATDCNTEPSGKSRVSGSTESPLPIFNEFFDSKKTNEILQYYNFYKKLPKDCPKQDLQTQYPTCEQGTRWVSSCHKCECNESGKHECIKIDDCELDFDSYGKPGRCKPNSKFYPKTNSMPCVECSCNDEGISYCPAVDLKKH